MFGTRAACCTRLWEVSLVSNPSPTPVCFISRSVDPPSHGDNDPRQVDRVEMQRVASTNKLFATILIIRAFFKGEGNRKFTRSNGTIGSSRRCNWLRSREPRTTWTTRIVSRIVRLACPGREISGITRSPRTPRTPDCAVHPTWMEGSLAGRRFRCCCHKAQGRQGNRRPRCCRTCPTSPLASAPCAAILRGRSGTRPANTPRPHRWIFPYPCVSTGFSRERADRREKGREIEGTILPMNVATFLRFRM